MIVLTLGLVLAMQGAPTGTGPDCNANPAMPACHARWAAAAAARPLSCTTRSPFNGQTEYCDPGVFRAGNYAVGEATPAGPILSIVAFNGGCTITWGQGNSPPKDVLFADCTKIGS